MRLLTRSFFLANGSLRWRAVRAARAARASKGVYAAAAVLAIALGTHAVADSPSKKTPEEKMRITSTAFANNGSIPAKHTCEGPDISPALAWAGAPAGTRSFALVVDDPDAPDPAAPKMTWVHWVLYDLPASATGLPEAVAAKDLAKGTLEGTNDWKRTGWGGPCPPIGRHRYFFKLYALDSVLADLGRPTKARLEAAMKGHVLAEAQLMGTYQKAR